MSAYEAHEAFRTVIYPIETPEINPEVAQQLESEGYRLKDEFHITVVNSDYGRSLSDEEFKDLSEYFESREQTRYDYVAGLLEIEKPKIVGDEVHRRRALVSLIASQGIWRAVDDAWYETGLKVPRPFLHVTVATSPDTEIARRGIALESQDVWDALSPPPRAHETEWRTHRSRKQ